MDEETDFSKIRLRSKSQQHRDRLLNAMLDADDEAREVKRDYQFVSDRVHKALLMSDKKIAHEIAKRISECKTARSIRSKKIRNKTKWHYDRDDQNPWYELKIPKHEQDRILDDEKHYLKTDYYKKKVCQSIWCNSCRYMASKTFETRIRNRLSRGLIDPTLIGEDHLGRSKALRREYQNDDLLHITGVVGLTDLSTVSVNKMLKKDTNRWRQVRYLLRKTPSYQERWIEVSYEFELVNWRHLLNNNSEGSEFKKKQMKQLIDHYKIKTDLFVFVHFHGVTNLSKKQLTTIFEKKYFVGKDRLKKTDVDTGLYIQKLHKENSLDDNIRKIASYNFKTAIRFKHNFRGKNYTNGEYFSNYELSELIILYHNIQKRSWRGLLRSCENDWSVEAYETEKRFEEARPHWSGSLMIWQQDVMVVDYYGNITMGNWDPDNFINKVGGVTCEWVTNEWEFEKVKVGREYFMLPRMPWLEVYKNIYDYVGTGKKVKFNTFKEAEVWWKKERQKNQRGKIKATIQEKNIKRWEGWDYDICDENLPNVMKKLMIFKQIDEFEKMRIREKKKRGHTNMSNYGPSRGREFYSDEEFLKGLNEGYVEKVERSYILDTVTNEPKLIEKVIGKSVRKPVRSNFDHLYKLSLGMLEYETNYDVNMEDVGNIEYYSIADYPLYLFLLGEFISRGENWFNEGELYGLRFNKLISQNQNQ